MAYRCINCNKGNRMSTRSQHHKGVAGGAWKHKAQKSVKLFKANLHSVKVLYADAPKRVKLCTDCISMLRKDGRLNKAAESIRRISFNPVSVSA